MPEIFKPATPKLWVARNTDGSILHMGETQPDQVTTSGLDVLEGYEETDGVTRLGDVAEFITNPPALPPKPTGTDLGEWLEQDAIYEWNGKLVQVRQGHWRVQFDPPDTPALFWVLEPQSPIWTAGTVYTQPATVTGAPGTPGEGRTWELQTASETASVGREPWQAYMWAVWAEVV